MKRVATCIVVMYMAFAAVYAAEPVPESEIQVLNSIYNSMGGAGWTQCNWYDTDGNFRRNLLTIPCTLTGIVVNVNQSTNRLHITGLNLHNNNLTGSIPESIGGLTKLWILDLSSNKITGTIPDIITQMNLGDLNLSYNLLTGNLPTSIGSMKDLKALAIAGNNLSGKIPESLLNCSAFNPNGPWGYSYIDVNWNSFYASSAVDAFIMRFDANWKNTQVLVPNSIDITATHHTLTLTMAPPVFQEGVYIVKYRMKGATMWSSLSDVPQTASTITLTSLSANKEYEISITASYVATSGYTKVSPETRLSAKTDTYIKVLAFSIDPIPQSGQVLKIQWQTEQSTPVTLELWRSGSIVSTITTAGSGGEYDWLIPTLPLSYEYQIRAAVSVASTIESDRSDTFPINVPIGYSFLVPDIVSPRYLKVYLKVQAQSLTASKLALRLNNSASYLWTKIDDAGTMYQSEARFNTTQMTNGTHELTVLYDSKPLHTIAFSVVAMASQSETLYRGLRMQSGTDSNGCALIYDVSEPTVQPCSLQGARLFGIAFEQTKDSVKIYNSFGVTGVLLEYDLGTWRTAAFSTEYFTIRKGGIFAVANDSEYSMIPKVKTSNIGQNYPNPFNPETVIPYTVVETAPVRLRICDVKGREVIVLVDAHKELGSYVVHWNGKDTRGNDMPSGIYYALLEIKDKRVVRKMVLLK